MKRVSLFLVAACVAGCAGKSVKTIAADSGKNIKFGYSKEFDTAIHADTDAMFFRLSVQPDSVRVTEISSAAIMPQSSTEEVLAYSRPLNMIGPAFVSAKMFGGRTFGCMAIDGIKRTDYHPCGTGSRFVSASAGNSLGRNLFAIPLTWGLGVGVDYAVNTDAIVQTVRDLSIERLAKRMTETNTLAAALNSKLGIEDGDIKSKIAPDYVVTNNTGFSLPALNSKNSQFTLLRTDKIDAPKSIQYSGDDLAFNQVEQTMQEQYDAIRAERRYNVKCPADIRVNGFAGRISCPQQFTYRMPSDTIQIKVAIDSLSVGTKFPSLSMNDKNISVSVNNGTIYVQNATNSYIEIQSISIYGGKEVRENSINSSLSPQSSNKSPYYVANLGGDLITKMFTFNNVKLGDIRGKSIDFGIAIKYRVGNGSNFESLYVKRKFDVASLI